MEVLIRPITVTEELAAVGRTRARRCRAALIERDADGDDRAGHGIVTLTRWRATDGMYSVRLRISSHMSESKKALMSMSSTQLWRQQRWRAVRRASISGSHLTESCPAFSCGAHHHRS
jgi:hypothetical protein